MNYRHVNVAQIYVTLSGIEKFTSAAGVLTRERGLLLQGLSAGAMFLVGYTPAFVLLALYGTAVLWLYGSFWITGGVIVIGGDNLLTHLISQLL